MTKADIISNIVDTTGLPKKDVAVVVEALSNKGIYVSSVSACHSKGEDYSYVIYAMNKDMCLDHNTIRVSFSYNNTIEEVETLTKELSSIIKEIKQ